MKEILFGFLLLGSMIPWFEFIRKLDKLSEPFPSGWLLAFILFFGMAIFYGYVFLPS